MLRMAINLVVIGHLIFLLWAAENELTKKVTTATRLLFNGCYVSCFCVYVFFWCVIYSKLNDGYFSLSDVCLACALRDTWWASFDSKWYFNLLLVFFLKLSRWAVRVFRIVWLLVLLDFCTKMTLSIQRCDLLSLFTVVVLAILRASICIWG